MNSHEFFLWLNGYLEALESAGITECKIENIRNKMGEIKTRNQERVVFGPNVKQPQQQGYVNPDTGRPVV
jgi:predicted transcriptional regulator